MARTSAWISLIVLAAFFLTAGEKGDEGASHSFHAVHGADAADVAKLDYDALYSEATPLSKSAEGQAVLDAMMAAYGGREHLATLESACLSYKVDAMGAESAVQRNFARGRYHIAEESKQTRSLDGSNAWFARGDALLPIDGGRYRAELFSYLTISMPQAIEFETFGEVRYSKREDDSLGYLFFDKPDSLLLVLGVDPETHYIAKSEGMIRQDAQRFVFVNQFSDHRDFGGFIFASKLVNISMGMKVAESELISAEVNCALDPATFDLGASAERRESYR